jgi:hypothetical protein
MTSITRSGPIHHGEARRGDGELTEWIGVREHDHGWVLRSDVRIQFAYGMESDPDGDLSFDWPSFPDPRVIGRHVEIKFNGQPVFRDRLISVDGNRCVLPLSASETITDDQGRPIRYAYSATKDEIALAVWWTASPAEPASTCTCSVPPSSAAASSPKAGGATTTNVGALTVAEP